MNRPKTSFTVVINGPVASAGSILFRYKNIGIKVPKRAAKIITVRSDMLTEIANKKPSSNGKKSKMNILIHLLLLQLILIIIY